MAYKPNIPAASDIPYQSQADIATNFSGLKTFIEVNHVAIDNASEGKHKYLHFPVQGAAAQLTPSASEIGVYSRLSTKTSKNELVFARSSIAAAAATEMTACKEHVNGWTRLPSGILMKWGQYTVAANGETTITFPTAATDQAFAAIYSAQLTMDGTSGKDKGVFVTSIDTTNIVMWNANSTGGTVRYLAIGK